MQLSSSSLTTNDCVSLHLYRASLAQQDIGFVEKGDSIPTLSEVEYFVQAVLGALDIGSNFTA